MRGDTGPGGSQSGFGAAGYVGGVTSVLIVDDHPMVRDGLAAVLAAEADLEVVATAGDVATARSEIDRTTPDVVVTDFQLPDGSGFDVVAQTRSTPDARVLLISAVVDGGVVLDAVRPGATASSTRATRRRELSAAVRTIAAGGAVFPATALRRLVRKEQPTVGSDLSERELEVLRLLARPMPVQQIATELFISVHTARNHLRSIMAKLDARSQLEAVVIAVRNGLIDLDPDDPDPATTPARLRAGFGAGGSGGDGAADDVPAPGDEVISSVPSRDVTSDRMIPTPKWPAGGAPLVSKPAPSSRIVITTDGSARTTSTVTFVASA